MHGGDMPWQIGMCDVPYLHSTYIHTSDEADTGHELSFLIGTTPRTNPICILDYLSWSLTSHSNLIVVSNIHPVSRYTQSRLFVPRWSHCSRHGRKQFIMQGVILTFRIWFSRIGAHITYVFVMDGFWTVIYDLCLSIVPRTVMKTPND